MKKVRICIPFYHEFIPQAGILLKSLARKGKEIKRRLIYEYMGYEFHVEPRHATQIFSGRNHLITDGTGKIQPFDYFFFLDSDVIGDIDDIITLLNMNTDIAVAPYKQHGMDMHQTYLNDEEGHFTGQFKTSTTGTREVGSSGTGFMLIQKYVFEKLDYEPFFFNPITSKNHILGEDIYFCTKARKHGFKVICNFDIKLEHKERIQAKINVSWEPSVFNICD